MEVDSSGMKNPVMYDIDKDGKADILGSINTGWPGYPYVHNLIIFGQDYVTSITNENEPVIKKDYVLYQNYPNPFNPTTNIKFSIVNSGDVKLVVYDIQGREVQTLVNESLKPGTYEAAFDGSALNSGVYFYKLVTGNFTETKKMLLIK
jgi:hypothetical protein